MVNNIASYIKSATSDTKKKTSNSKTMRGDTSIINASIIVNKHQEDHKVRYKRINE